MTPEPIAALADHLENIQKDKKTQGTPEQINKFYALLHGMPVTDTPQDVVGVQSGLASTTIKIDLEAKVVGVLGQGINKLVSMQ